MNRLLHLVLLLERRILNLSDTLHYVLDEEFTRELMAYDCDSIV